MSTPPHLLRNGRCDRLGRAEEAAAAYGAAIARTDNRPEREFLARRRVELSGL